MNERMKETNLKLAEQGVQAMQLLTLLNKGIKLGNSLRFHQESIEHHMWG
jgi:type II secretory pathway component PulF